MIEYRRGNLLDVTTGIIAHGCNMQGVMGAGVAKQIKSKYPEVYSAYTLDLPFRFLGDNILAQTANPNLCIANLLIQKNIETHKHQVNYVSLAYAFSDVVAWSAHLKLDIHFPKIVSGLAGDDWKIIGAIINDSDPSDSVKKICWEL